jgi:hypothetical protein
MDQHDDLGVRRGLVRVQDRGEHFRIGHCFTRSAPFD